MVFESIGLFMSKLMMFHGYINDYNGFPDPLTKEEEEKLVDLSQNGDVLAREKLINHNLRLVAHVCKKYNGAAEADDLISVGSLGLIKVIFHSVLYNKIGVTKMIARLSQSSSVLAATAEHCLSPEGTSCGSSCL